MHDDSPDRSAEPQTREVSMLSQVSNEMVKLYKDQFGRGPTKARTAWAGPDTP